MNINTLKVAFLSLSLVVIGHSSPALAGTAQPLPATSPKYPIVCVDTDTGKITLVADGKKVRVAYWNRDRVYFTSGNRASRHKPAFPAPRNSECMIRK